MGEEFELELGFHTFVDQHSGITTLNHAQVWSTIVHDQSTSTALTSAPSISTSARSILRWPKLLELGENVEELLRRLGKGHARSAAASTVELRRAQGSGGRKKGFSVAGWGGGGVGDLGRWFWRGFGEIWVGRRWEVGKEGRGVG